MAGNAAKVLTWYFLYFHRWLTAKGILCFFVCLCVRDHILKVCERDTLQTACGNFAKFATLVCSWEQRWTD